MKQSEITLVISLLNDDFERMAYILLMANIITKTTQALLIDIT